MINEKEMKNTEKRNQVYLELLTKLQDICVRNGIDMFLTGHAALGAIRDGILLWDDVEVCVEAKDTVRLVEAVNRENGIGAESMLSNESYPSYDIRIFDPETAYLDTSDFFKYKNNCMHITVKPVCRPLRTDSRMARRFRKLYRRLFGAAALFRLMSSPIHNGGGEAVTGEQTFESSLFAEKKSVTLCGRSFFVPADTEAFMKALYGPGWEYLEPDPKADDDTRAVSTERSWNEVKNDLPPEEVKSYKKLLAEYRRERAEVKKESRTVSRVYQVVEQNYTRVQMYKAYSGKTDVLRSFLDEGRFAEAEEALKPYLCAMKKFLDMGLDLYVNSDLHEITAEFLEKTGKKDLAEAAARLIPEDHKDLRIEELKTSPAKLRTGTGSELSKTQKLLLELMKRVDAFLKENDIEYFLFGGSLLGAVRHNGFIPWDDDIDIVMDRENYYRLVELSDRLPWDDIVFDCYERNHAFQRPFGMFTYLRDTRFVKTRVLMGGAGLGTGIDVFVMDNVPREHLDEYIKNSTLFQEIQTDSIINSAMILDCIDEYFECKEREKKSGKVTEVERLIAELEKYGPRKEDDLQVVRLWFRKPRIYEPGMMACPVSHIFEDTEFLIPARAEECLLMQYGEDWNVIPDDQHRDTHAFYIDHDLGADVYYDLISREIDWERVNEALDKTKQNRVRLLDRKLLLDEYRQKFTEACI